MHVTPEQRPFDLEVRTRTFARNFRAFIKTLPSEPHLWDDIRQLIRSSGSIGANYLEAQEAVSRRDFCHKIKISRKEARESVHWLDLIHVGIPKDKVPRCIQLKNEAEELVRILTSIVKKTDTPKQAL
ncbi:four helix bundle protein [Candidatus Peregrinibacteria bacterium]|nr:four helix bundle protein [Candidatus Peregrinibacteria bacterium]